MSTKWSPERKKKFLETIARKKQNGVTVKPPTGGRTYHGWILVEEGGQGYRDYIRVEWQNGEGRHSFSGVTPEHPKEWRGESGAAQAVEWWDKKLGQSIKLLPMLKGSYRVYTE